MPDIAPKPLLLLDITLSVGTDDYAASVNRALLTPTTATAKWKGMRAGSAVNLAGEPDWVLDLSYAQDFETVKSLSLYLLENHGQTKEFTLAPKRGGKAYKVKALCLAGPIGGDLGAQNPATGTVQLPVDGQPVPVAAA